MNQRLEVYINDIVEASKGAKSYKEIERKTGITCYYIKKCLANNPEKASEVYENIKKDENRKNKPKEKVKIEYTKKLTVHISAFLQKGIINLLEEYWDYEILIPDIAKNTIEYLSKENEELKVLNEKINEKLKSSSKYKLIYMENENEYMKFCIRNTNIFSYISGSSIK